MSLLILACVAGAAILHAGWNTVLRGGEDRLWSMTLMMAAITAVTGIAAFFLPWPRSPSWPYALSSATIHVGYNLSLVRAYRSGDLGQSYPVSRGSSPLLVALGALIFAHERLGLASSIGIVLVSGGILSLAFQGEKTKAGFLPAALTTGVLIGAYTVVDGIGVRLSGNSLAYANSLFLLWSLTQPLVYYALRRTSFPTYSKIQIAAALAGGLVSILAYGLVIWAMQYAAMGAVSALRETSVVWAALMGWAFLKERLTTRRIAACLAIAAGAACLAGAA